MNFMYTICTKKDIGKVRKLILKALGVSFVNHYQRSVKNG